MKYLFTLLSIFFLTTIQAQQTDIVDFKTLSAYLSLLPETKSVEGQLDISFQIKKNVDSIFIDAKNTSVKRLKKSPLKAKLHTTNKKIWIIYPFKANKTYQLKLSYQIQNPKKTLYFVGWDNSGSNQIWSQGEGHHTSYWLPSIDDKNDKITFEITYQVPQGYSAIGNGRLIEHQTSNHIEIWHYKMSHPMSSYLVAVAVGKYEKKTLTSAKGTPIQLYYEPQFADKVEPTYRYSQEIFDFLEKEIGVDYPWENYKQIPVRDFLYAGMENTTTTIFAESFMTDSIGFIDRNYVNVNAHELAHQWFGDLVTEESSKSHWLQEGFATYYALLAERKIFGDEYYYYKLFENANQLKEQSDHGKGEALINPKSGSLTFYQKGAWALHILREKIGDQAFKEGIKTYLEKHKFKNVSNEDFITAMQKSSGQDLSDFVENWLKQSAFQAEAALQSLRKSPFIVKYLNLAALKQVSLDEKFKQLDKALDFPTDKYMGQEAVNQLAKASVSEMRLKLYKKAFTTNNILVRQAIAASLQKIPKELKSDYESLLNDDSYLTMERALFNLWQNFPQDRKKYLEKTKSTQGFYDKNVKMLWLTLSLVTQDYHPEKSGEYYKELSGYTSPSYDYSIRQNTFGHLYQINTFTTQNYKDLIQACVHPVWRFRKFARELLGKLLEESVHKDQLRLIKPQLPEKQQKVLEKAFQKQSK